MDRQLLLFYPTTMKKFNDQIFDKGIGTNDFNTCFKVYLSKPKAICQAQILAQEYNEDMVVIEIDGRRMIADGNHILNIENTHNGDCLVHYVDPKYFRGQINIHINDINNKVGEEI